MAARSGAALVSATVPFPCPDAAAVVAGVAAALTPRTRLAVIDHVTSHSALVLPLADIVAACHAQSVPVLADGAHGPGNLDLDIPATGADYYAGNCHKWLSAPKGCAFLWVRPERQAGLHPVTISHGYEQGFLAEFDWTGTRDFSAWLAVTAALDFHASLGGPALRARNRALAAAAGERLAARLGTGTGAGKASANAMATIRLPLAGPVTWARVLALRERLLDAGTDAPVHLIEDAAWLRISAQAYNDMEDYDRLAGLVATALAGET